MYDSIKKFIDQRNKIHAIYMIEDTLDQISTIMMLNSLCFCYLEVLYVRCTVI